MKIIEKNIKELNRNILSIKGVFDRKNSKMINRYVVLEFSDKEIEKQSPYDQTLTTYGIARTIYDSAYLINVFRYTRRRYLAYLLEKSVDSIENGDSAPTAFLLRSFIEHSTNFIDQSNKIINSSEEIRKLISEGVDLNDKQIREHHENISNLIYSSRLKKNKIEEFLMNENPTESFGEWIMEGGNPNRKRDDPRTGVNALTPVKKSYNKIPKLEMVYALLCEYIHPNSDPISISQKDRIDIKKAELSKLKKLNDGPVKYGLMGFRKDIFEDYKSEFEKLYLPLTLGVISECTNSTMETDLSLNNQYKLLSQSIKPTLRRVLKRCVRSNPELGNLPCVCDSNKYLNKCCGRQR